MKNILIFKACQITDKAIPSVTITISKELSEGSFDHHKMLFIVEAKEMADALQESLPGGCFDALVIELLTRTKSFLHVPKR